MSDFILYYDRLEAVANHSKSLGKRADEYAADLERKIISGIGTVTGPSSGYLLSASDSVRDKITALKQKSQAFYQFAEQIMKLLEVAEQMDQEVADAITGRRGELEHHKSLGLEDWKAKLIELLVDIKNGSPPLSTIADLLGGMAAIHESLNDSIKHWYETEAGKRKGKEAIGRIETHINIAGVAATGVGVASLFHGMEFDLFKNGPMSFSNLNNWKGNGKVELKDKSKKVHSNDSVADGLGNTVAGFRQLEMQDNRSVSEAEVIFIAEMESIGMTFDKAYDLTVALRVNKGTLTQKQYREFGFADIYVMGLAELQYRLVQEGMTVEQIDYMNSSERLAQAVTMSIGMLVTAGVSIRGSGSIARSVKKPSNVPKGTGKTVSSISQDTIKHSTIGDFTYNPKTGAVSKVKGGGHGQANIDFLEENGIPYNIEKTYDNGVRIGNIPDHKNPLKRIGTGQSWFPETWDTTKINKAGEYVVELHKGETITNGVPIYGIYDGVEVGVIYTNDKPATIFPNAIQP